MDIEEGGIDFVAFNQTTSAISALKVLPAIQKLTQKADGSFDRNGYSKGIVAPGGGFSSTLYLKALAYKLNNTTWLFKKKVISSSDISNNTGGLIVEFLYSKSLIPGYDATIQALTADDNYDIPHFYALNTATFATAEIAEPVGLIHQIDAVKIIVPGTLNGAKQFPNNTDLFAQTHWQKLEIGANDLNINKLTITAQFSVLNSWASNLGPATAELTIASGDTNVYSETLNFNSSFFFYNTRLFSGTIEVYNTYGSSGISMSNGSDRVTVYSPRYSALTAIESFSPGSEPASYDIEKQKLLYDVVNNLVYLLTYAQIVPWFYILVQDRNNNVKQVKKISPVQVGALGYQYLALLDL